MIGLGVCTFRRPAYFEQTVKSIVEHLTSSVDYFCAYDDGSEEPYGFDLLPNYTAGLVNRGVGYAKNRLLESMLEAGCDWLFLCEDDVLVQSDNAITGYVNAAEASGLDHLMFHAHGELNLEPVRVEGPVTYWPHYVGAWSMYSRRCLEDVGLMDERFVNAFEHVEHSVRLGEAGWTSPWQLAADATGSEEWLTEIPGSRDNSVIFGRRDAALNIERATAHWAEAQPATFQFSIGGNARGPHGGMWE